MSTRQKTKRVVGGRVPQEKITYLIEMLTRARNITNHVMTILDPYFQIPSRIRDQDEHLTAQQRSIIERDDLRIKNLMDKIERRYRELCKHQSAFKNSHLARSIHHLEDLYMEMYREQWGGYQLYDEINIEVKLRAFHIYINTIVLEM